MKSYTDIEQSKKLVELGLDPKTADMNWHELPNIGVFVRAFPYVHDNGATEGILPCWSLTALLDVLPSILSTGEEAQNTYEIDIRKHNGEVGTTLYQIAYGNNRGLSCSWHDMINTGEKESLIDACYEMILKLYSKNLI